MTDKDIRRLEKAMERVVREVLDINYDRDDETTIPMSIIDEIQSDAIQNIQKRGTKEDFIIIKGPNHWLAP